jgi:hypothetical protein
MPVWRGSSHAVKRWAGLSRISYLRREHYLALPYQLQIDIDVDVVLESAPSSSSRRPVNARWSIILRIVTASISSCLKG